MNGKIERDLFLHARTMAGAFGFTQAAAGIKAGRIFDSTLLGAHGSSCAVIRV